MTELLDPPISLQDLARISVADFHRADELGIYGRRAVLIRGLVTEKPPRSPLHLTLSKRLYDRPLRLGLPGLQRAAGRPLHADPNLEIVGCGAELFKEGCQLYAARLGKEWSLTDCASFILMRERGLEESLTTDHHFEQAGFRALLRA